MAMSKRELECAFGIAGTALSYTGKDKSVTTLLLIGAKELHVSIAACRRAFNVLKYKPELKSDVCRGRMPLTTAAQMAHPKKTSYKKHKHQPETRREINFPPPRSLTREEIDPHFTGNGQEFAAKHGYVQTRTAAEKAAKNLRHARMHVEGILKKVKEIPAVHPEDLARLNPEEIADQILKLETAAMKAAEILLDLTTALRQTDKQE